MEKEVLLKATGVSKFFGPTKALQKVDIEIRRGEVLGLIGENGSGKSTFSLIVAGVQPPTEGEIVFNGVPYHPKNALEAEEKGITMVVQEANTIAGLSIAENIFVGKQDDFVGRFGLIDKKRMERAAQDLLQAIGVENIDASAPLTSLSFEERKLSELARAAYVKPELFIADETTTALSQGGRDILYSMMNEYRETNKAVLFISHDLDEMMQMCDRLIVLKDGCVSGMLQRSEMNKQKIQSMMVGRELQAGSYYRANSTMSYGKDVLLEVRDISVGDTLEHISFDLHQGEILGIAGLSDCGMHELGRGVFGIETLITGTVKVTATGKEIKNTEQAIANQMGYVSKNRDQEALLLQAPVKDNIVLPQLKKLQHFTYISPRKEKKIAQEQIDLLGIKCRDMHQNTQYLSGGNKQKVVFSKWYGSDAQILVLDCPTRGVDIGVKHEMYKLMEEFKQQGKAMIMISEELPELIGMSDRLMVLRDGVMTAMFHRDEIKDEQPIIPYMI